jgi:hypothetical protein
VKALVPLLLRLFVVGMLVSTSILAARGEEIHPEVRERGEAGIEWSKLAKGRTEFEVSDPALLPTRLVLAAKHAGCRFTEDIEKNPVRFIKPGGRRLAIMHCWAIVGSHQVFDLSVLHRPRLIEFPSLTMPEGFGMTDWPGWLTWDRETWIFQAVTGSDMKPSWDARHTYRYDQHRGFVIIRVEVKGMPGYDEWTTIWQASPWLLPGVKQ